MEQWISVSALVWIAEQHATVIRHATLLWQLPRVLQVGVFDTAFHQTMPPKAYMYGIPYDYYTQHKVCKGLRCCCHSCLLHVYCFLHQQEQQQRHCHSST
jgi:acetate kinase